MRFSCHSHAARAVIVGGGDGRSFSGSRQGRPVVRVLIVEDEVKMARALRRGLEQEGYAVDTAGDGEEGVFQGTENPYDVIVLDVMLPGLDARPAAGRRC
jgi:PleD family two-component response regulator